MAIGRVGVPLIVIERDDAVNFVRRLKQDLCLSESISVASWIINGENVAERVVFVRNMGRNSGRRSYQPSAPIWG